MEQYTQLKEFERTRIYEGLKQGFSQGEIARSIGRDSSTISREIRRNSDHIGYLFPRDAQKKTDDRKARYGSKIARNTDFECYMMDKLNIGWSPEVIAGRWKEDNPKQSICTEAVYQYIYNPKHKELQLWKLLKKRKRKRGLVRKARSKEVIQNRTSIHKRPKEINDRKAFGHYEGDLFFNRGSQSTNVLTAVERVSRKVVLIKQNSKHSVSTISTLKEAIGAHAKSCTFDNGTEFSEHQALDLPTFFCDPYSPWQKGSVENAIKLVRSDIPFNMHPNTVTQELLNHVVDKLNNRPRKILGFRTPHEVFEAELRKEEESRLKPALPAVEASFNLNLQSVALHP